MLQRLVINGPSVNLCHAADCIRDRQRSLAKCLLCSGLVSKQAIANWRALQKTLRQMQRLSREELFDSLPGPQRRKKLSKKVLGLV
jgi:hypothetical protein